MGKGIMLQGTASSVGKSILAVGLCRVLTQDGYEVAPFKSQNMSLNSFITPEGGEIGRAQAMQAEACNKLPNVSMNPILLKPTSDRKSQVIFEGKVHKSMDAVDYFQYKPKLKQRIQEIYDELAQANDIVVIEGAGSPAEINLKDNDFVNMGMAEMAKAPVILIGDIDQGGVFASLAGTLLLLTPEERQRVKGVIINKFRGSLEILEPGLRQLEEIINVPVLGVVPYFRLDLEEEDSATDLTKLHKENGEIDVAIIRLPYMSNFTDFNAFKLYDDVKVRFVDIDENLGTPDLVIIPGTKTTIHDMKALRKYGMDQQILRASKKGSYIFGICGGYQMLGAEIIDEANVETNDYYEKGLGLLPMKTTFADIKTTTQVIGQEKMFNTTVNGYEIHMGTSSKLGNTNDFIKINKRNGAIEDTVEGQFSEDKKVAGTYFHGIFDNSQFTRSYLNIIRESKGLKIIEDVPIDYTEYKNQQYDELAKILRESIDMNKVYEILNNGLTD